MNIGEITGINANHNIIIISVTDEGLWNIYNILDFNVKLMVLHELSQLSKYLSVIEVYLFVVKVRGSLQKSLETGVNMKLLHKSSFT